jgi:hypothetical protein
MTVNMKLYFVNSEGGVSKSAFILNVGFFDETCFVSRKEFRCSRNKRGRFALLRSSIIILRSSEEKSGLVEGKEGSTGDRGPWSGQ